MNTPDLEQFAYTQEGCAEVLGIKPRENKTQPFRNKAAVTLNAQNLLSPFL
jgi:hypothetical protein